MLTIFLKKVEEINGIKLGCFAELFAKIWTGRHLVHFKSCLAITHLTILPNIALKKFIIKVVLIPRSLSKVNNRNACGFVYYKNI